MFSRCLKSEAQGTRTLDPMIKRLDISYIGSVFITDFFHPGYFKTKGAKIFRDPSFDFIETAAV